MEASRSSGTVLDRRTFTTMVDEQYIEVLGRAPAGTEPAFAAVRAWIDDWEATRQRLEDALKDWDGKSTTIRFLKDEYRYFLRPPHKDEHKEGEVCNCDRNLVEKTAKVFTVLNAVQVPVYIRRLKDGIRIMHQWIQRMDRRLIGQDGKSRAELVDAFQNAQGRIMPAEMAAGITIVDGKPKIGDKSLFRPLKEK